MYFSWKYLELNIASYSKLYYDIIKYVFGNRFAYKDKRIFILGYAIRLCMDVLYSDAKSNQSFYGG